MRDIYLTEDRGDAEVLADKAIVGCLEDEVPEIQAHHDTGASNGPTEGLNLAVKRVKRCGHGFRRFEHYRLRVLLHAGGVKRTAAGYMGSVVMACSSSPRGTTRATMNPTCSGLS
ncbi:MAG: transposase [Acidimicrobiia bacterium]